MSHSHQGCRARAGSWTTTIRFLSGLLLLILADGVVPLRRAGTRDHPGPWQVVEQPRRRRPLLHASRGPVVVVVDGASGRHQAGGGGHDEEDEERSGCGCAPPVEATHRRRRFWWPEMERTEWKEQCVMSGYLLGVQVQSGEMGMCIHRVVVYIYIHNTHTGRPG